MSAVTYLLVRVSFCFSRSSISDMPLKDFACAYTEKLPSQPACVIWMHGNDGTGSKLTGNGRDYMQALLFPVYRRIPREIEIPESRKI